MSKKKKPITDAAEILHRRYYAANPKRLADLQEARANEEIARRIRELRGDAGISQVQLAKLLGTNREIVERLEDADFEGNGLAMLQRIAAALNKRVEIRFVPAKRKTQTA